MKKLLLKMLPIFIFSFGFAAQKRFHQFPQQDRPETWRDLGDCDQRLQPLVKGQSHASHWGKPGNGLILHSSYRVENNRIYCVGERVEDWGRTGRQRDYIVKNASRNNDKEMLKQCEKAAQKLAEQDQETANQFGLD